MAKAFKKPNLKLLKAIRYIQREKNLVLKSFSIDHNWYCFSMKSHSFVLNKTFYELTGNIFDKNLIHFTNNEITFFIK